MGRWIVAWRDSGGNVCVADAYCPHMGAKLTPATGGRVSADKLKCPFHGFEYDISGKCVNTPDAPPPKNCALNTYRVHEDTGFVFAYWGNQSRVPDWTPPMMENDGWSSIKVKNYTIRTHVQDITENSVDINHQKHIHNWDSRQSFKTCTHDRYYNTGFSITGRLDIPGFRHISFETHLAFHIWGLGFMYAESESKAYNVQVRTWYLPVPVDNDYIEVFVATQLKRTSLPAHESGFNIFHKLGGWSGLALARQLIAHETARQFQKDILIWNHRRYLEAPALCSADGELHKFRKYCRQFYPDPIDNENT